MSEIVGVDLMYSNHLIRAHLRLDPMCASVDASDHESYYEMLKSPNAVEC